MDSSLTDVGSSLTSPWCIRDWSVMIMDWSGPYADIITDIITDQSLMHQGLVSDDPTPVSDESMKISDESRTGQGWVHDDQWRVQDWYWGESMVIKTIDWQLNHYKGPRPAKDHHWPVPDESQTVRLLYIWLQRYHYFYLSMETKYDNKCIILAKNTKLIKQIYTCGLYKDIHDIFVFL